MPALEIRQMRADRPMRLDNVNCPYCGLVFRSRPQRTLEHVIGRKFVPKGATAKSWNLHLSACGACNREKADLENDLSSITLHQLVFGGGYPEADGNLLKEVTRKGPARSTVTGRYVSESQNSHSSNLQFGPIDAKFDFIAPPSIDPARSITLAAMHLRALTYLLSYDEKARIGNPPPVVILVAECGRRDWGNERSLGFMKLTEDWLPRFCLPEAASGYFKACIRRKPDHTLAWSWALEWNRLLRLMGFFGEDAEQLDVLARKLPDDSWQGGWESHCQERGKVVTRYRIEAELLPEQDTLFREAGLVREG